MKSRPRHEPVRMLAIWLAAAVSSMASLASAQSIGVDPYDPWNAMYRPFVRPQTSPMPSAIPNQSRIGMFDRGSTYGDFSINNVNPYGSGRSMGSRFVPYYMRQFRDPGSDMPSGSAALDRSYIPNRGDRFFSSQAERERRFFEALRERDPRKRAELLRKVDRDTRTPARSANTPTSRVPAMAAPEAAPGAAALPSIDLRVPGAGAGGEREPSVLDLPSLAPRNTDPDSSASRALNPGLRRERRRSEARSAGANPSSRRSLTGGSPAAGDAELGSNPDAAGPIDPLP